MPTDSDKLDMILIKLNSVEKDISTVKTDIINIEKDNVATKTDIKWLKDGIIDAKNTIMGIGGILIVAMISGFGGLAYILYLYIVNQANLNIY